MFKTLQDDIKNDVCFFFFQALPRFVYSFGQRHPQSVPASSEASGWETMTDADNAGANIAKINGNLKKTKNERKIASAFNVTIPVPFCCAFSFIQQSISTRTSRFIRFKHESSTIKEEFQFWSKANEMLSFLNF